MTRSGADRRKKRRLSETYSVHSEAASNDIENCNKALTSKVLMERSDDDVYDSDREERMQLEFLAVLSHMSNNSSILRMPQHTSLLTGAAYTEWVLNGHPATLYSTTRLKAHTFQILRDALYLGGYYEEQRSGVKVNEALLIFLSCIAHDRRVRDLCDRFQHSPETITQVLKRMRKALYKFSHVVICPRNWRSPHPRVSTNPVWSPYFKDCIGAIDMEAWSHEGEREQNRNHHGYLSQNVLAAVDHDLRFVYVLAGFGGSAPDATVLCNAITETGRNFPMPLVGKFYAVDSAYKNMPGFLAPYRGEPYHIEATRNRQGNCRSPAELYNHRHVQLRNVVERAFGALKGKWKILKGLTYNYKQKDQAQFVLACCTIHNIIVENDPDRPLYDELVHGGVNPNPNVEVQLPDYSDHGSQMMKAYRDQIEMAMWRDRT